MISPCLDCNRRSLGCHDRCCRFKNFKKAIQAAKEKRSKDIDVTYSFVGTLAFELKRKGERRR